MLGEQGASPWRRGVPALALMSVLLVAGGDAPTAGSASVTPQVSTGGHWVLTFQDEFNGTSLDRSKWSNGFGWGQASGNTVGFCDPANNVVGGGALIQRIERRAQGGKPFSVGCINGRDRFSQLYGYWEARMWVAGCPGARGAFWAKPNDESWPPELDVVEVHGDERDVARLTIHWREGGSIARSRGRALGSDFSTGYHVFGAEWSPTETIWYVDGVERRRTQEGARFMDDGGPFYMMVNAQVYLPSSTCGEGGSPSHQYVDYVRVWARSPVSGPGPGQADAGCRLPTRLSETLPRLPPGTEEASGVVASERYPGVAWLIRDSGHPPSLYALRMQGGRVRGVREIPVSGAANRDWEDVTYTLGPDGRGRLWVVESGQAGGDRYLYEIPEPDPDTATRATALRRYRYAFPDLRRANTEASFVFEGKLVLVTKASPSRVYRFEEPLSTAVVNRPVFKGELRGANRVSVVRASPDRRLLVAANHKTFYVYDGEGPDTPLAELISRGPAHVRSLGARAAVEAGDWFPNGSCQVLLLSEHRGVLRLRLARADGGF